MLARYVPGTTNPYFSIHKYHGIPVNRNIRQPEEWKTKGYVAMNGKAYRGVTVELLTAEHLWETFQKEAEDLIKVNGKFIENDIERNRRINAAYAKLWLADNRFQWAGLAAFASKQVGCGLLHAHGLSEQSKKELRSVIQVAGNNTEAAGMGVGPAVIRNEAEFMYERLGFGNKCLFLDIYPLHRFYMERGIDELTKYLFAREKIKTRVAWDAGGLLDFGKPFREIRRGFDLIEAKNIDESVQILARHEQINILQAILYNDPYMQKALSANQFAWANGFPSGFYMEIQLTLSAQCKAKEGLTSYFPGSSKARLWMVEERIKFVNRAAARFSELLRGKERPLVEKSLQIISSGGGVV
ncbi:DUF2515 family protein [Pseudoduganella lutea]|uniref:Uncharacterized protein n=1 Tax=Pseudoduganella lutea TaxID=321985 RepID=A0A4P6KV57_9BURK|nr:hypothetical protein [Pseudoduganella lutea]QBE62737.1 hypothetical protein EWM63_06930 [Pseudoduganella lutea]